MDERAWTPDVELLEQRGTANATGGVVLNNEMLSSKIGDNATTFFLRGRLLCCDKDDQI
jgi:hypothetical protein